MRPNRRSRCLDQSKADGDDLRLLAAADAVSRIVAAANAEVDLRRERSRAPGENLDMPDPLELLVKTEMPYGKHKGTVIADLPGNYLNWFAREGFPPGRLGELLALMHEVDQHGLKHLLAPLRNTTG